MNERVTGVTGNTGDKDQSAGRDPGSTTAATAVSATNQGL
jgi:hypothetical protein